MNACGTTGLLDIVVHADAVGAAYLMRAVLALGEDACLSEENGRWQVVVHPSSAAEPVLACIVDCVASCADERRLEYATLSFGNRSYTVYPPDQSQLAAAAAA